MSQIQPQSNSNNTNMSNNIVQTLNLTSQNTYSNIVQQSKQNAIVIPTVELIPLDDYLEAISNITNIENITHASKITNERVCIYFKTQQLANDLIKSNPTIQINNHTLPLRKLITPSKKLFISGLHPFISNQFIINLLDNFKIRKQSQLLDIKIGTQNPRFAHIKSLRKLIFIHPDDAELVPDTIVIEYETEKYRIFFSIEDVNCSICNGTGHSQNKCPKNNTALGQLQNTTNPNHQVTSEHNFTSQEAMLTNTQTLAAQLNDSTAGTAVPLPSTSNEPVANDLPSAIPSETNTTNNECSSQDQPENPKEASVLPDTANQNDSTTNSILRKREHPKSNTDSQSEHPPTDKKTDKKKLKRNEDSLKPIKTQMLNNPELHTITYDQLSNVINDTIMNKNTPLPLKQHNCNPEDLKHILQTYQPLISSASMKRKFTFMISRLNHTDSEQSAHPSCEEGEEAASESDGNPTMEH